jgi:6,7-dimethyl-8-ribityllumazine synthase
MSYQVYEGKLDASGMHAFEIPYVAAKMAGSGNYDAVICLGAVVRGDTPHFDYIASESAKGIARIALEHGLPVVYGLVTADTLEQAIERAGTKAGNKGWDAAESAIEMVNLYRALN